MSRPRTLGDMPIAHVKSERSMEERDQRTIPMKARRGGIGLSTKHRMLQYRPCGLHGGNRISSPQTRNMSKNPEANQNKVPARWGRNQKSNSPNICPEPTMDRLSPQQDNSDDFALDKEAQLLLHQFLARSQLHAALVKNEVVGNELTQLRRSRLKRSSFASSNGSKEIEYCEEGDAVDAKGTLEETQASPQKPDHSFTNSHPSSVRQTSQLRSNNITVNCRLTKVHHPFINKRSNGLSLSPQEITTSQGTTSRDLDQRNLSTVAHEHTLSSNHTSAHDPQVSARASPVITRMSSSEDNFVGSSRDQPTTAAIRRSRRSRAAPVNYYAIPPGFPRYEEDGWDVDRWEEIQIPKRSPLDLGDASAPLPTSSSLFEAVRKKETSPPSSGVDWSTLLRTRELGYTHYRGITSIERSLYHKARKWERWKSWKGASNDVLVVSWSPDGTRFAAGAAAQCDEHNMQYNKNNNLLLGDLTTSSLKELPDHRIQRPLPAMLSSGPNAQQDTYNTADPNLYMSVTAVKWSHTGDRLFTASYDQTVKLWDVSTHTEARCISTWRHPGKVQVMAISGLNEKIIATGCEATPSIGLWNVSEDGSSGYSPLEIIKPRTSRKNGEMSPTSLAWGLTSETKNVLVAGLSCKSDDADPPKDGHLGLWLVSEAGVTACSIWPNSQNVFDVVWHPNLPVFASGGSTPLSGRTMGLGRDIRSLIRVYDPLRIKSTVLSYECPALDMNDVTFCPTDTNYITASCTDGITYVWDYRNRSRVLHKLQHGDPVNELDAFVTREQADVGVRLALWGDTSDQFYTGASDGVLKLWNVLLAEEDALVENVASFGEEIMSGAFSPDKTNLLIGDTCGGLHVFSIAPFGSTGCTHMNFEAAVDRNDETADSEAANVLGTQAANELIRSGQLTRHPIFGVGQGPRYGGPYAAWARPKTTRRDKLPVTPLDPKVRAMQLDGPPAHLRRELDAKSQKFLAQQIQIARTRNMRRGEHKRKRERTPLYPVESKPKSQASNMTVISLLSDDDDDDVHDDDGPTALSDTLPNRVKREVLSPRGPHVFIDLTGDEGTSEVCHGSLVEKVETLREKLEEDHWWPRNCDVDANIRDPEL